MKKNNLILICGIITVFLMLLSLSLVTRAEELDPEGGEYQEFIYDEDVIGDEEVYSGSESDDHLDMTDPEEEQDYVYKQDDDFLQDDNIEDSTDDNDYEEMVNDNDNQNEPGEQDNQENIVQDDYQEQIITLLNNLDQTIKKLIISLWVLFGLLLGSKLIKGLFGYG